MNEKKMYGNKTSVWLFGLITVALLSGATGVVAGAREDACLLTATEVLQEVEGMPDQRLPDLLLQRAYGIAVIPDVDKVAFFFGGRRGKGVLTVRDSLTSPWSNPSFITLTGGSWGLQVGAQSSDIILVFTTKTGIEGIAGGKLTLGADASVATGPVGRQGSAATDLNFNSEIYSYARTRGLFGGIALDGSVIKIDASANAAVYGKSGVTATEIFSGQAPAAPEFAQRFLARLAQSTGTAARASPVPQADQAADPSANAAAMAPAGAAPRTYPLEQQQSSQSVETSQSGEHPTN
jgi:lipid-binding SYLF domain-containing protein